ncbi:MAG: HIT family protein [Thermoplasmatota archaeon]
MECIFCAIVAGDIPSTKVHEDDLSYGFLDIQPLARGHALVIPKQHGQRLADLSPQSAAAVIQAAQALTPKLCQAVGAVDATIAINDGPDAGQEVPHCHIHIVPRRPGDAGGPVHALFPERPTPDADDMAAIAAAVTA